MRRNLIPIAALLVLLVPSRSLAQTGTGIGIPPFGSFTQSGPAITNNQNLNGVFSIPIVSSPGRGLTLNFSEVYNSQVWTPYLDEAGAYVWAQTGGWIASLTGGIFYVVTDSTGSCDRGQGYLSYTFLNGYKYQDTMGTLHPLPLSVTILYNSCTDQTTYSGTYSGYATDNSGYYASIANPANSTIPVITTKSGVVISTLEAGSITDPNGNFISTGSGAVWTDSAGRAALKIVSSSSSIKYEFLDPTGNYQTTTVNLTSTNVKTNFGCSGIMEYSGTQNLPTSVVFPNNQTYTITYEPTPNNSGYYTGRVQKITLPTGGSYQWNYLGSNDGISCTDGTTLDENEVVSDGTNSATWSFVRGSTTTITTPALPDIPNAYDTVISFTGSQASQEKIYKESPGVNVLRTINTTWASNNTPATVTTILEDGSTQSEVATTYDSNGLLDSVAEYGFGSGAPGSVFRTTNFTYNTSSNYTSRNIIDLVTSKQILDGTGTVQYRQDTTYDATSGDNQNCPTGVPQHNDTSYGCSFFYRGNPTSITTYLSPSVPSNGITKNFTYDFFGNLLTAQVNCCQNKTWSYSSATEYSEPDSVTSGTSPLTLTTSATYNAYTGQVASFTDENSLVTNFSYDYLRRPTQILYKYNSNNVGGTVTYSYNDSTSPFSSTTTAQIDSSKSLQQITSVDGLGRPNLTTIEDAGNNVKSKVSVVYDLTGRAYQTSNPYTGSSGSYWTTTAFDALGRPTSVALPDTSATTYTYSTDTATVADPAGIKRESVTDPAGRLSSVYEPDPTNGNTLTLQTSYTYNILDELTQVSQGSSQTRTYVYDALGRLNSVTTPEAGTVCLGTYSGSTCQSNGYDDFDNLLYRTDARGVVTNYIYDTLNRPLGVTYPTVPQGVASMPNVCKTTGSSSNNANVCFTYGTSASSFNNGRLASLADPTGSESYTYNDLGQLTQLQKIIGTQTFTTSYAYNLASELTQVTYPSGRVVQQSVDSIGRLCEIAPSTTGCGTASAPFATGFGYSTANQVTGFKYGNAIYASYGFSSDRLQLNCLDYSTTNRNGTCTHDSTSKFSLAYSYPIAPGNNGQISSITDNMDNGRTITYTYDWLYRMTKAVTTGSTNYPAWGLSETYDRYGNRSAQAIASGCTGITCPTSSVTISATTNQLTGSPYAYDACGNMTNDGVNTLTYDGEGRAVTASGSLGSGTYTVDGNGLRVKKVAGSTTTVYVFSGSKVIAEYQNGAAPSSPTTEYIYAGGALLAKINSSGTFYYHQDHLSNRIVTTSTGSVYAQMGHFPFGESWYNASGEKLLFTTYERDAESGNDYAMARYHVSRLGRLSSPDPLSGSTSDPQSLNRYAYSLNDPGEMTDPSGLCPGGVAQSQPANDSQQSSGHGPSADSSDGTSGEGQQNLGPCTGSIWQWLDGESVQDGGDITDTSGAMGMGFSEYGGIVAGELGKQPFGSESWQYNLLNYWGSGTSGSQGGGVNSGPLCGIINCGKVNPPPPPGWQDCMDALGDEKNGFSWSLWRATFDSDNQENSAAITGIDPNLLAAMGIHESRYLNVVGDHGHGHGIWQADDRSNQPFFIYMADNCPACAAIMAGQQVMTGYSKFSSMGYSDDTSIAAALRSYNAGLQGTINFLTTPGNVELDLGTANNNYVSKTLAIWKDCF